MSITIVRDKLAAALPGTTALTMKYEPRREIGVKPGEVYTAMIGGKEIAVTVATLTPADEIVAQFVAKMAGPVV